MLNRPACVQLMIFPSIGLSQARGLITDITMANVLLHTLLKLDRK
jgi:hypothetical protein